MTKARDIASATTPNANAALLATFPHRNLIINGAMQVAQRGTSVASSSGSVVRCVDRHRCFARGAGAATFSQTSTAPTGQGFANSLRVDVTTVDSSLDSNDYYMIDHKIEGQDLQQLAKGTSDAKSITASFWVRSTKTGTYILGLFDDDNSRNISKSYSIYSADTWEYKTITFEGDTTGALDNDNNVSFTLRWFLGAGTSYTSGTLATSWEASVTANQAVGQANFFDSTSNDFYITGIQLEVGDTATQFEHRSYGDELARCQRYYYEHSGANSNWLGLGNVYQTDQVICPVYSPTVMRALPTLTKTLDGSSQWLTTYDGFTGTSSDASVSLSSTGTSTIASSYIYITGTGRSGSDGQCHWLVIKAGAALHFDAEL